MGDFPLKVVLIMTTVAEGRRFRGKSFCYRVRLLVRNIGRINGRMAGWTSHLQRGMDDFLPREVAVAHQAVGFTMGGSAGKTEHRDDYCQDKR